MKEVGDMRVRASLSIIYSRVDIGRKVLSKDTCLYNSISLQQIRFQMIWVDGMEWI